MCIPEGTPRGQGQVSCWFPSPNSRGGGGGFAKEKGGDEHGTPGPPEALLVSFVCPCFQESPAPYGFSSEQRGSRRCGTLCLPLSVRYSPAYGVLSAASRADILPNPPLHPRTACPRLQGHPEHPPPGQVSVVPHVATITTLRCDPRALLSIQAVPTETHPEVLLPRPAAGPGQTPGKRQAQCRRWRRCGW